MVDKNIIKRIKARPNRRSTVPCRVLHLSTAHPWSDNRIHWREAVSLVDAGYDVGLHAVDTEATKESDEKSPVRVSKTARLPRFRRMTVGTLYAFRVALASDAELVHIHDPELIWIIPFLRAKGRKVIYDAHEDLPAQVLDKPYLPLSLRKMVSWAAKGLVHLADVSSTQIIAATETIAKRFSDNKTTIVRNFPHLLDGEVEYVDVADRDYNAVYVGGISRNRGGDVMVDAFASSKMPSDWCLLMAGQMSPKYLENLQLNPGWEKVKYLGKVPPRESRSIIGRSRIGIVALKNTVAYQDSLPTKMFEYMAEGAVVIASDFPLWRAIIEKYDCGTLIDETSSDAIAEAIAKYAENEDLLRRHSCNGMQAAREILNWENEAKKLVAMYQTVLDPRKEN